MTTVREHDPTSSNELRRISWRAAEGTYQTTNFLDEHDAFNAGSEGQLQPTGTTEGYFYVHIPLAVRDAEPGTVPIVLFGHGLFGHPNDYVADANDPNHVIQLAEEGGYILIGMLWRGLSREDLGLAAEAAANFGMFPRIPARLLQAQTNTHTLIRMIEDTGFLHDPIFTGANGQSLPDRSALSYYGISLGAIEGAVLMATQPSIDAAALHVGGAVFSTMLERSSNWTFLETILAPTVEDPTDRQLLYAASQLFWDPVDPIAYAEKLVGQNVLLHEAIGDEQVPNLASQTLARSLGMQLLQPAHREIYGLSPASSPAATPGIFVQFDPGIVPPDVGNRPASVMGSHEVPRTWPGARHQIRTFISGNPNGGVIHYCGDAICSDSNTGSLGP